MATIAAVVLAGGKASSELQTATGESVRARIPFRGEPMVEWVVKALQGSPYVGRIAVVGDVPDDPRYTHAEPGASFLESVRQGVAGVGEADGYLLITADIPFITSEAINHFVTSAIDSRADFCYAIVKKDVCESEFPGLKRTCLKLKEGEFTGGNLAYVTAGFLRDNWSILEEAYGLRKHKFKLAARVGFWTLFRAALGQALPYTWSVGAAEKAVGRMLHANVCAIVSPYAGVGTDIDTVEHWQALNAP